MHLTAKTWLKKNRALRGLITLRKGVEASALPVKPDAQGYVTYNILPWPHVSCTRPIRSGVIGPLDYPGDNKQLTYSITGYRQPEEKPIVLEHGNYVMEMKVVFGQRSLKKSHRFEVAGEFHCIPPRNQHRNMSLFVNSSSEANCRQSLQSIQR